MAIQEVATRRPLVARGAVKPDTSWFKDALKNDKFTTFFQPIVNTADSTVFGHECMMRLVLDRVYSGAEIINAAVSGGRIHLFDSYARRLSIRKAAEQFVPGTKIFLNMLPSSIYDPASCMTSTMEEIFRTSLRPNDIVFEIVQDNETLEMSGLRNISDYYRKGGFGLALDNVDSGTKSLELVRDLKPDYIKLDRSLVSKLSEPLQKKVIERVVAFAAEFKLQVIAEGVETKEMIDELKSLGIRLMQGHYFGQPAAEMKTSVAA